MREKPIIFNTEMVKAILEGRKTQTRRIILHYGKTPEHFRRDTFYELRGELNNKKGLFTGFVDKSAKYPAVYFKSRYQPGDILYVRETWTIEDIYYIYKADLDDWSHLENLKWCPSIHMPREAARIFLKVIDVKVERLQDITEEDAMKEGFIPDVDLVGDDYKGLFAKDRFIEYWNKLNAKRGYGWNMNPWVWVIEFERLEGKKC